MDKVLITTTNSVADAKIVKYLGIISSNVVVGTNIFSDFVASFSDIFGGLSGTYRNQLQRLYSVAIDDIREKALKVRANGIIGLHIDFDEISGKGKAMFMVSIVGTAVSLKFESEDTALFDSEDSISIAELQLQVFRNKWSKREIDDYPTEEDWVFILSHEMPEIADSVYQTYLHCLDVIAQPSAACSKEEQFVKSADEYFSQLDYDSLVSIVYPHYNENPKTAKDFILKYRLFNAEEINKLLHSDSFHKAIYLLSSEKDEYTIKDVHVMKDIISFIDNLPDKGKIEEVKGGLLSSNKLKYICPNGHKNNAESEFCSDFLCGLNIKGLVKEQVDCINALKERTEALVQLFNME